MDGQRGGEDSCQAQKEEPFVDKAVSGAAWSIHQSRHTTADDRVPAANYAADGELLKWGRRSNGRPFCAQRNKR